MSSSSRDLVNQPSGSEPSSVGSGRLILDRAAAYDRIYTEDWHSKGITREGYEADTRFFLDTDSPEMGDINGDEITYAYRLIGVEQLRGKTVLDYCCGTGRSAIYMALWGARVYAFDASRQAVAMARRSAELSGVADRVCFSVMDAQHLAYPDQTFDAVFCQSALHIIIDYPRCSAEMVRILKPGGLAVFCEEALGHNPLLMPIRWLRRRRYKACGGRTLTYDDLHGFGRPFAQTHIHHFNLFSQVKILLGKWARRSGVKAVLRRFYTLDQWLLSRNEWLRKYAGKVVVEYRRGQGP